MMAKIVIVRARPPSRIERHSAPARDLGGAEVTRAQTINPIVGRQ